ncbi:unnamed protein product [Lota lota]
MKLWDSLTTCLFLLSSVHASPQTLPRRQPSARDPPERPLETPPVKIRLLINPAANTRVFTDRVDLERMADKEQMSVRSSRGERGGGGGGGGGGGAKEAGRRNGRRGRGGQGCMLKQIHLNVSDLGLGYQSEEEMIFRYCSGPCRKSETNYDKILHNIAHDRRLGVRDTPPNACCRPIAFDDNLSFLDDNLVYHTIRKHSARKCGCV